MCVRDSVCRAGGRPAPRGQVSLSAALCSFAGCPGSVLPRSLVASGARRWLPCCAARAQGWEGSAVAAHGLGSSMAGGVSLDQGSGLCPLNWQVDS